MSQTQAIRLPRRLTCPATDRRQIAASGSGVAVRPAQRFTARPSRDYGSGCIQTRMQARNPCVCLLHRHRNLHTVPGRKMQALNVMPTWRQIAQDVAAGRRTEPAPAQIAEARIAAGGTELVRRIRDLAGDLEADASVNNTRAAVAALTSGTLACMYRGRAEASRDAAERLRALLRP